MRKHTQKIEGRIAVGYVRVSSARQADEGISLDAQRERIKDYCRARGLSLLPLIHADEGVSGRKSHNRPGLAAAIAAAKVNRAALVVFSLSRFARSTRDCIDLAEQLSKGGADLISISESIDTTSAHGRFFYTLLAALAQLESDQTGERLRAVFAYKRDRGEVCGNTPPYGYRVGRDGVHLVADKAEAETLKMLIRLRLARNSWGLVRSKLIAAKRFNRAGKPFSTDNLSRLFRRHGPKVDLVPLHRTNSPPRRR